MIFAMDVQAAGLMLRVGATVVPRLRRAAEGLDRGPASCGTAV